VLITTQGQDFFVHNRIISAAKRVIFVSGKMPYVTLKGHWCDIIVLNAHAPTEDEDDDVNGSFWIFYPYPRYHL
jgi:predicted nucleotidyltransferase